MSGHEQHSGSLQPVLSFKQRKDRELVRRFKKEAEAEPEEENVERFSDVLYELWTLPSVFSDIVLALDTGEYEKYEVYSHRAVLGSFSRYFSSVFELNDASEIIVRLRNEELFPFIYILRWMHTGLKPEGNTIMLYKVAMKFWVMDLVEEMTPLLRVEELVDVEKREEAVLEKGIKAKEERWLKLPVKKVVEILQSDGLYVDVSLGMKVQII